MCYYNGNQNPNLKYSNPPTSFRMYVFVPGPDMLNKARRSLDTMLKTASSCWTTTIRSSRWTTTTTLGLNSRALLKLRSLSLDIRRGLWRFWSWLRGVEELKMASRCTKTSIRTSSEEQQLGNELWEFLFSIRRFCRRNRCLAMLPCLISNLLQRFIRPYLDCWALGVICKVTRL